MSMTLDRRLRFLAATYSINGTFIGLFPLHHILKQQDYQQTCYRTSSIGKNDDEWEIYGHTLATQYAYECGQIYNDKNSASMHFYDLYLEDDDPQACRKQNEQIVKCLHPIPVQQEGEERYTRRFFLLHSQEGATSSKIRYAKHLELTIRSDGKLKDRIHTPILRILYDEINLSNNARAAGKIRRSWVVQYTMNHNYQEVLDILCGVTGALSFLVWGFYLVKNFALCVPSADAQVNDVTYGYGSFLMYGIIMACKIFVFGYGALMFFISTYW